MNRVSLAFVGPLSSPYQSDCRNNSPLSWSSFFIPFPSEWGFRSHCDELRAEMKDWYYLRSDTRAAPSNPQSVPITASLSTLTLASSSLYLGQARWDSLLMRVINLSIMECSSSPSSFRKYSTVSCNSRLEIPSCFYRYAYRSSKAIRMKFHGRSFSCMWS